jgi:putative methyltransferase
MKNIYLANFSMTINPGEHRFLPYSVTGLWAYAKQDRDIANEYMLADVFFEKNKPIEVHDPKLFGFSVYIWNENYTDNVAKTIKQQHPECLIVYGGPQVPKFELADWWQEHLYVDVVVFGEGEIAFKEILKAESKSQIISNVNISVNIDGVWTHNWSDDKRKTRQMNLTDLPSPYLTDVMPTNIEPHHAMLFETNRGCP